MGFKSPLPIPLGISAVEPTTNVGFRSPVPIPLGVSAIVVVATGGFITPLPFFRAGAGLPVVLDPVVTPIPDISVSGADVKAKGKFEKPIIQLNQPLIQKGIYSQLYAEDEEVIALVMSMIKAGII